MLFANYRGTSRPIMMMFQILAMLTTAVAMNPTREACDVCECKEHIVNCTGRGLTELPRGIPNGTKALDFVNNSLHIIEKDTFKRCTNLLKLYLDKNRITDIQPGGFAGLENINSMNFRDGLFEELGPENTEGLQNASTLRVENGTLKVLRPHTFGSLRRLTLLRLSGNNLEEIPPDLFLDPKAKEIVYIYGLYLHLGNNKLRRVSPGAFRGVKSFECLKLYNNKINSSGLPGDTFHNTTVLSLDLSSNRLTYIPTGLFRSQTDLLYLFLQRNRISVLDDNVFAGLSSLRELLIFDNPITELVDWLFYETQLTHLYIFQNELASIGERPFATKNNTLQYVSMYANPLRRISDAVWQDLANHSYVSTENILEFAPVTNRNDLKIELVGDGFAQSINASSNLSKKLRFSGFRCIKFTNELWHCKPCPHGTYGTPWTRNHCTACPPGGFYQIKTGQVADVSQGINCQRCNNGTYVTPEAHPGITPGDCKVCPTGTNKSLHAGFRACPCLDGYYRTDRFGECHLCPTEGINCSEEYQHLRPGFWWTWDWGLLDDNYLSYERFVQNVRTENQTYDNTTKRFGGVLPKVHKCPRNESCENAVLGGINASCEEGYTGWLCSECSPYYYSWFDQCFECPKWWLFLLEVIAVCVVVVLVVVVIAWQVRKSRRNGRSVVSMLLARGKILLGFYQVVGEIFSALDEIAWPTILTSVGSVFRLLEVNIMRLLISPRCYVPSFTYPNIYIEYLAGITFVVFVLLTAWCFYSFKKCYLKAKKTPHVEQMALLSQTKQRCYLFVVILLFISYPSLSSVILTLLPSGCDLFHMDENNTFNVTRFRANYSIDCQTQQHINFNYAAEVSLFYVVGFPLVLFFLLWWNARKRKKTGTICDRRESGNQSLLNVAGERRLVSDESDDELILHGEPPSQAAFTWESFLCENYKQKFWYWEIVELARKIVQTLLVLLYGPDDHFTMFVTIVISVGFLLLHAYVKPMKDAAEHRLQMCSLGTIFLNLLAASLLLMPIEDAQSSQYRKEVLSVVLVLMNLSIVVFVIASLIWTSVKAIWRYRCLCRLGSCIAAALGWCCRPEIEVSSDDSSEQQDSYTMALNFEY